MKSTLTFLGKDAGFGNDNNSAYYENEDMLILIDCGFTVFNKVKEKFDFNKYKQINVIVTHLHNDHAGSLSQFILYLWFVYNKKTTVISKCNKIKEYLEITGTPDEIYELKTEYEGVEFIKTEHVEHLDSYGFTLKLKDRKILYTGDTKTIEPFLKYINEIDELYIDVSKGGGAHIKIEDVLETLQNIKNKGIDVFLMHLDEKKYISEITNNNFFID